MSSPEIQPVIVSVEAPVANTATLPGAIFSGDNWWDQPPTIETQNSGEITVIRATKMGEVLASTSIDQLGDETEVYDENKLDLEVNATRDALFENKFPEDQNTSELFNALPPVHGINIEGQQFLLSQTATVEGRDHCVGYVRLETGQVAPRLFYRSNSDGDWRVSPYYDSWQDQQGRERGYYSKGDTMEYGYVRETRLVDDLRVSLEQKALTDKIELSRDQLRWVTSHFSEQALGGTNSYKDEAFEVTMGWGAKGMGVFDFIPGQGFKHQSGKTAAEVMSDVEIPDMLKPDFSQPVIGVRISRHPILGQVTTEQIPAANDRLVWNFSRDLEGRVWVSGIVNKNVKRPNTYGTDDEVYIAGVLDNKPIEYASQVEGLREGQDFKPTMVGSYVDITPLLDHLPVIQDYRAAREVPRQAA